MRRACLVFSLVLIMGLVSSCTSLSLEMRAQNEGVPTWVYTYDEPVGRISFVGTGTDADSYRARLKAYIDISDQLAVQLGNPLTDAQYRELTTLSTIKDYSLTVVNRFEKNNADGTVSVYFLAVASESRLLSGRSAAKAEMDSLALDVRRKLDEAQTHFQNGEDILSAESFLDAATVVAENNLEGFSLEELTQSVCNILNRLRISITDSDNELCRYSVNLQRQNTLFPSPVDNATVKAAYMAEGVDLVLYEDSNIFQTEEDGTFRFISPNSGLVKKGTITFSVDLGTVWEKFCQVVDAGYVQMVQGYLDGLSVSAEYDLSSPYAFRQIVLSVREFNIKGEVTSSVDAPGYTARLVSDKLSADGVSVSFFNTDITEDEEAFDAALENTWPGYEFLIDAIVGVSGEGKTAGVNYVLAEGEVTLYRRSTGETIYNSGMIYSSGTGDSGEQAVKEAFKVYADIIYSQIRDNLFFF